MKGIAVALFALLALAAATIVLAPATVVDAQLAGSTSGNLRLGDAKGRLWHGSGTLTPANGAFALPVTWAVDASALVRGEVAIRLLSDETTPGQPSGTIRFNGGAWRIENLRTSIPASALVALAGPDPRVALGGTFRIDLVHAAAARSRFEGSGSLRWTAATVGLPLLPPLALGNVEVAMASRGSGLAGTVSNRGGDLRLTGELYLDPTQSSADLLLVPEPHASPTLVRVIGAIGRPEGDGARWRWQGPPILR
jgi:hypothetical protein